MKISRIITATLLICLAGINFAFSQNDAKKDKPKSDKTKAKSVEVKANLLVMTAEGKFIDDVKSDDLKVYEDGVEQKITYFAKNPNNLNVGFVIDNTGSMRSLLGEIVKAASILAANLQSTDEAFVVRFVNRDKISIEQPWSSDKTVLKDALENLYIEGGLSAITDALYLSAEQLLERRKQDAAKRYALILISDGEEIDSYYKTEDLFAILKGTDVQIFMLSYANLAPKNPKDAVKFSNRVTFETGGIVRLLSKKRTTEEILDALKAIVGELRSNYIIGYTSTNQIRSKDAPPRKLSVQIADGAKGEKRLLNVRESFVVPENK